MKRNSGKEAAEPHILNRREMLLLLEETATASLAG